MLNEDTIKRILNKIGALVAMRAKENCPVDLGVLRASIGYRIEGNTVIIFATAEEGIKMEYGTPPEPLSDEEKEKLKLWAERHGLPARSVIKGIEKKGIKVGTIEQPLQTPSGERPFLRPALFNSIGDIKTIVREEIR